MKNKILNIGDVVTIFRNDHLPHGTGYDILAISEPTKQEKKLNKYIEYITVELEDGSYKRFAREHIEKKAQSHFKCGHIASYQLRKPGNKRLITIFLYDYESAFQNMYKLNFKIQDFAKSPFKKWLKKNKTYNGKCFT